MLIGIDKSEVVEFVSKFDTDKENPTVFEIGILQHKDKLLLKRSIASDGSLENKANALVDNVFFLFKKGVKKIRNFSYKDTTSDITDITDEIMESIAFDVIDEVAGEVLKKNFLSESERKN